ncbi:unnamed protein product [Effrenium voratum]|uniref:Uncharacterized protein n=1 Tax=Effrenium voratum TaxID=2562239 RepID=A0AA36MNE9_9DINO|nr:unnamed protein product [Effrenium voratum]CAJ1450220.1 unnamed protein product [Effrenium voratum]
MAVLRLLASGLLAVLPLWACDTGDASEPGLEHLELLQQQLRLRSGTHPEVLPLTWVHFPKAGSGFLNVLVHTQGFCPGVPQDLSVETERFSCRVASNLFKACPQVCDPARVRCHASPYECVGSRYSELEGRMVGVFRQPEQRALAAYHDELRTWMAPQADCAHRNGTRPPAPVFARFFAGTVAYQLVGEGLLNYGGGHHWLPGLVDIPERTTEMAGEAVRRLQGFAFVGITEEWDLSICLFRKIFGGPCRALDFSKTQSSKNYDTAPLEGFQDEIDGIVYQEAMRIFRHSLLQHNVSVDSCRDCFAQAGRHGAPNE